MLAESLWAYAIHSQCCHCTRAPQTTTSTCSGSCSIQLIKAGFAIVLQEVLHYLPRPDIIDERRQLGPVLECKSDKTWSAICFEVCNESRSRIVVIRGVPEVVLHNGCIQVHLCWTRFRLSSSSSSILDFLFSATGHSRSVHWALRSFRKRKVLAWACPCLRMRIKIFLWLARRWDETIANGRPIPSMTTIPMRGKAMFHMQSLLIWIEAKAPRCLQCNVPVKWLQRTILTRSMPLSENCHALQSHLAFLLENGAKNPQNISMGPRRWAHIAAGTSQSHTPQGGKSDKVHWHYGAGSFFSQVIHGQAPQIMVRQRAWLHRQRLWLHHFKSKPCFPPEAAGGQIKFTRHFGPEVVATAKEANRRSQDDLLLHADTWCVSVCYICVYINIYL